MPHSKRKKYKARKRKKNEQKCGEENIREDNSTVDDWLIVSKTGECFTSSTEYTNEKRETVTHRDSPLKHDEATCSSSKESTQTGFVTGTGSCVLTQCADKETEGFVHVCALKYQEEVHVDNIHASLCEITTGEEFHSHSQAIQDPAEGKEGGGASVKERIGVQSSKKLEEISHTRQVEDDGCKKAYCEIFDFDCVVSQGAVQ